MTINHKFPETDPRYHSANVQDMIQGIIDHLQDDMEEVGEPRAKILFETAVEVLLGLQNAFRQYEQSSDLINAAESISLEMGEK